MKFFVNLYGTGISTGYPSLPTDRRHAVGNIFGPFADNEELLLALEKEGREDPRFQFLVFEGTIMEAPQYHLSKPADQRRQPGDYANFEQEDSGYRCRECGEIAVTREVMSQTPESSLEFKTVRTPIPVCLNCDKRPEDCTEPVVPTGRPLQGVG